MAKIKEFLGAGHVEAVQGVHDLCLNTAGGIQTACGIPVEVQDRRSFKKWLEEEHTPSGCRACAQVRHSINARKARRLLNSL